MLLTHLQLRQTERKKFNILSKSAKKISQPWLDKVPKAHIKPIKMIAVCSRWCQLK